MLLGLVLTLLTLLALVSIGSNFWLSRQRQEMSLDNANRLLTRAEGEFLTGRKVAAAELFMQAREEARSVRTDSLLVAEACYGLARVAREQGNVLTAQLHLEEALSTRVGWEEAKPEFAKFLERELASLRSTPKA